MAGETSDDRIVHISEKPEDRTWLMEMMKGQEPQSREKPRIQKVGRILHEIKSNEGCFDPMVVSFGPYHHGNERLTPMEPYKEVAGRWLVSLATGERGVNPIADAEVNDVYSKFVAGITQERSPRDYYSDMFLDKFEFEYFMRMMFLDGSFILHFIHLIMKDSLEQLNISHLNLPFILRDMFLLENQIPYTILKVLMRLMPKSNQTNEIEEFINSYFLRQYDSPNEASNLRKPLDIAIDLFGMMCSCLTKSKDCAGGGLNSADKGKDPDPLHLLDFLRSKLIGNGVKKGGAISPPPPSPSICGKSKDVEKGGDSSPHSNTGFSHYYFRSIMELKTAGIKIRRSKSKCLKDIKFENGLLHGHLWLPQFMVDDATKTGLLNLIAYEMGLDGPSDRTVTSYICFLDSLIDHADDVKELRSKNILLNRLGSDEEVANLFNELANSLTPNPCTYTDVMEKIEKHVKSQAKVWIAEFMHTHFTSPWTVLALVAAIFVIILTVVQTVYAVADYYKK